MFYWTNGKECREEGKQIAPHLITCLFWTEILETTGELNLSFNIVPTLLSMALQNWSVCFSCSSQKMKTMSPFTLHSRDSFIFLLVLRIQIQWVVIQEVEIEEEIVRGTAIDLADTVHDLGMLLVFYEFLLCFEIYQTCKSNSLYRSSSSSEPRAPGNTLKESMCHIVLNWFISVKRAGSAGYERSDCNRCSPWRQDRSLCNRYFLLCLYARGLVLWWWQLLIPWAVSTLESHRFPLQVFLLRRPLMRFVFVFSPLVSRRTTSTS